MATDKKPQFITAFTPKGIATDWPTLIVPDTKYKAEGEYKTGLILSEEDSQTIRDKIDELTADKMAQVKEQLEDQAKNGKDGKAKAQAKEGLKKLRTYVPYKPAVDDEGDETGDFNFKFSSAAKVKNKQGKLVDKTIPIFDAGNGAKPKQIKPEGIWYGSVLKLNFTYVPFHNMATGDVGVKLRLEAVQVIELRAGGSGGRDPGFESEEGYEGEEAAEGGFESEEGHEGGEGGEAAGDDNPNF